jgi:hypothetical protein
MSLKHHTTSKFSLPVALPVVAELGIALEPACLRVVACGSVRRERPEVGDGTHMARASAAKEKHRQCPLAMEKKPRVMSPKECIESQARARAQQMKLPADEVEGGKDSSCGVIEGSSEIRHSAS